MPVSVVGGEILTNTALNCRPCSRSVTQAPEAEAYSPGKRRGMSDQGDQFSLAFDLQAQNTITVLLVVEGDAFNQAGEAVDFGGGRGRHKGRYRSRSRWSHQNGLHTRIQNSFDAMGRHVAHRMAPLHWRMPAR